MDCYIPNQEENLVSRDRDGIPYTMQYWYEGRECDTRSKEDIFKSIRTMAELHQRMHIPTVEYYIEPSLENGYLRHNQELKKSAVLSENGEHPVLLKNISGNSRRFPERRRRGVCGIKRVRLSGVAPESRNGG